VPGDGGRRNAPAAVRSPAGRETQLERVERIADAYGLVLVLILTTFVVTMTLPPEGWGGRVVAIAVSGLTAIIALTSSDVRPARVRLAGGAALAAVRGRGGGEGQPRPMPCWVPRSSSTRFCSRLLRSRSCAASLAAAEVDFRTILGAISVFTVLGLLFGYLFLALGRLHGGNVFAGVAHAQARDYLFFSYTTLTTTGYGNLTPSGTIGQSLAVFEMLTGQIFLVTPRRRTRQPVAPRRPGRTMSGQPRPDDRAEAAGPVEASGPLGGARDGPSAPPPRWSGSPSAIRTTSAKRLTIYSVDRQADAARAWAERTPRGLA